MLIEDKAIILSARYFQESYIIVKCLLENHGILAGLYRISKKQNSEAFSGNIVDIKWRAKLSDQLGHYQLELIKNIASGIAFNRSYVTIANAAISITQLLLHEREPQAEIFYALEQLLVQLYNTQPNNSNDMLTSLILYSKFEMKLLSKSGFGLDLRKCVVTNITENLVYISPKSGCAVSREAGAKYHDKLFQLPQFLINLKSTVTIYEIIQALNISRFFIEKHALSNGTKLPIARMLLIELLHKINNTRIIDTS